MASAHITKISQSLVECYNEPMNKQRDKLKRGAKRDRELEKYIRYLLGRESVKVMFTAAQKPYHIPHVYVSNTCGVGIAGQLWYYEGESSILELSSWILVDIQETRRVIRHELAHDIKTFCGMAGTVHGRGFNQALRGVSKKRWKKDKHWHTTSKIDLARKKFHPRIKTSKEVDKGF